MYEIFMIGLNQIGALFFVNFALHSLHMRFYRISLLGVMLSFRGIS